MERKAIRGISPNRRRYNQLLAPPKFFRQRLTSLEGAGKGSPREHFALQRPDRWIGAPLCAILGPKGASLRQRLDIYD
jgi:hypothetical protein